MSVFEWLVVIELGVVIFQLWALAGGLTAHARWQLAIPSQLSEKFSEIREIIDLERLGDDISTIQHDVDSIREVIDPLPDALKRLANDISTIHHDVDRIHHDVDSIQHDVASIEIHLMPESDDEA